VKSRQKVAHRSGDSNERQIGVTGQFPVRHYTTTDAQPIQSRALPIPDHGDGNLNALLPRVSKCLGMTSSWRLTRIPTIGAFNCWNLQDRNRRAFRASSGFNRGGPILLASDREIRQHLPAKYHATREKSLLTIVSSQYRLWRPPNQLESVSYSILRELLQAPNDPICWREEEFHGDVLAVATKQRSLRVFSPITLAVILLLGCRASLRRGAKTPQGLREWFRERRGIHR